MDKKKRVFRIIGNCIFAFLIVFIVLSTISIIQTRNNPNKIPSFLGVKSLTVLTGSMRPKIQPGDMVIIREKDPDKIDVGDVITYRLDSSTLVTHRVNEIKENNGQKEFVTLGDANNAADIKPVKTNQLIGSYIFKIPKGGYIARFIRSPLGFILIIIIPLAIIISLELKKTIDEENKIKAKDNKQES